MTGRTTAAGVAPSAVPARPAYVPDDVWQYVLRYEPTAVPSGTWAESRGFVLLVVGRSAPHSVRSAKQALVHVSQFAGWAVDKGLPLDPEKVLTPDLVARHVEETSDDPASASASSTRARLSTIGRKATTRALWPGRQRAIARTPIRAPYTTADLTLYAKAVDRQRTEVASRYLGGLLVLCHGAGATSGQALAARTDVLVLDGHRRWCVRLSGPDRLVPLVVGYVDRARALAAGHPGEPWLTDRPKGLNWLSNTAEDLRLDTRSPALTATRLRTTWLVDRLNAGVPVRSLVLAAGLRTTGSITDLLPYLLRDDAALTAPPPPAVDRRGKRVPR